MGAFVDHVQSLVAPILLHRKIAGVAITTVDLDGQAVALQTPFAGPAFHNRRQHFQQPLGLVLLRLVAGMQFVHQTRTVKPKRQSALAIGFLRQQHALNVGVFNQAHGWLRGVFARWPDWPALGTGFGVVQRGIVASHSQHGGGQSHTNAGLVHHVEHALQALARFADQITHRPRCAAHWVFAFAKIQQGVDRAAPAQLVVQAGQRHIVAFTGQLPLGVHQFFGHDEQRNAFGAGNGFAIRPWDFGQHQVDDVLGQLVVTGGDPHFVALEAIAGPQRVAGVVVTIGRGAGGHIGQR